jgi:PAS domain S-box-containing protein
LNRNPVRGAARLAAILDALPDALLLVDASGTVVNANAMALELFEGESAERLLGKTVAALLPGYGRSLATPGSGPAALPAGSAPADSDDPGGSGAPGSVPADDSAPVRSRPQRMAARRTDDSLFPAEVTSSTLPGDEDALSLLVVRDLSGTLDLEAELRRQQRQIELILRAASEGIVGVDHEGRIVLVNPAGAKILRHRASDLGGQDAHELIAHSTAEGVPIPPEQFLLVDSLRTGAKHHSVDETLWRSDGSPVAVDITTAPVYEGDTIIGAVMTFADNSEMRAATRRAEELAAILDDQLRAPLFGVLADLREVGGFGIGELGPAVRQALTSITADLGEVAGLVDDIVDYQQMVVGRVSGELAIESLSELIESAAAAAQETAASMGVQIAVHAAEVPVPVDPTLFPKLLEHLLADMVTATPVGGKIVMTGARRGPVARIEIRGPHTGGGPLHVPIARAIAARHGGTVTTHRIVGKGNTHVVEVPIEAAAGTTAKPAARGPAALPAGAAADPAQSSTARPAAQSPTPQEPVAAANGASGTYERRAAAAAAGAGSAGTSPGTSSTGNTSSGNASSGAGTGTQVVDKSNGHHTSHGADRRRAAHAEQAKIPPQSRSTLSRALGTDLLDLKPSKPLPTSDVWNRPARPVDPATPSANGPGQPEQDQNPQDADQDPPRQAAGPAQNIPLRDAMPPMPGAPARRPAEQAPPITMPLNGSGSASGAPATDQAAEENTPRGRRRAANPQAATPVPPPAAPAEPVAEQPGTPDHAEVNGQSGFNGHPGFQGHPGFNGQAGFNAQPINGRSGTQDYGDQPGPQSGPGVQRGYGAPSDAGQPVRGRQPFSGQTGFVEEPDTGQHESAEQSGFDARPGVGGQPGYAVQPEYPGRPDYAAPSEQPRQPEPLPAVEPWSATPPEFGRQTGVAQPPTVQRQPVPAPVMPFSTPPIPPAPMGGATRIERPDGSEPTVMLGAPGEQGSVPAYFEGAAPAAAVPGLAGSAPDQTPAPVAPGSGPRLLLWPQPDPTTLGLLSEFGYRPTILDSPESFPVGAGARDAVGTRASAVLVDPIAAPITRRGLRTLRGAAIDAGLPILVTAGIGCAPSSTPPGPGPALLVHALTPASVTMPRVLLVEGRQDLAEALTRALGGQGIQVLQAATDSESITRANDAVPDVVVLDLMQVRRRRVGIIEWLQDHKRLEMTPIVVYTALGTDSEHFAGLSGGLSTLYLAERSTDAEVGNRLADLLAKTAGSV